jgi:hypothetical protein
LPHADGSLQGSETRRIQDRAAEEPGRQGAEARADPRRSRARGDTAGELNPARVRGYLAFFESGRVEALRQIGADYASDVRGARLATGHTVHACVDAASMRPVRIPDWLRADLARLT